MRVVEQIQNLLVPLVIPLIITVICASAAAQSLQSGQAGFGLQWVQTHPFVIQADSWDASHWNINQYFGAGMTMLMEDPGNLSSPGNSVVLNRPAPYAHAPWQGLLGISSVGSAEADYDSLKDISGNAGWIAGDEPNYLAMPNNAAVTQYIRQSTPFQPVYTTALNNTGTAQDYYGDSSQPNYTYDEYLNDFLSVIHPDILAFDYYPFAADGSTGSGYFQNLMSIRSHAQAAGLPYWGWIQAFGNVSESDNRLNVFTHLTAGYTGLLYWTYDYYGGTGNGLLDANGNPTPLYAAAAQTNAQAARLGRSLRLLTSTDVRFIPGRHGLYNQQNPTPAGLLNWDRNSGGDPHLTNISVDFSNSLNEGAAKDGLIGFFTDAAGQHYFMLTNLYHGADLSADAASLSFVLTFDSSVNSLLYLDRLTGEQQRLTLVNHQLSWSLPGGTGDLFKYDTGDFAVPEPAMGLVLLVGMMLIASRRTSPLPWKRGRRVSGG